MMKKLVTIIAALGFAAPAVVCADESKTKDQSQSSSDTSKDQAKGQLSPAEIQVIANLHHANQHEVDLANYALNHGTKAVKSYSKTIVRDHSTADRDLTAFAKKHDLATIPQPENLPTNEPDNIAHLKGLTGAKFDRAYIDMMVTDHQDALNMVDTAMAQVTDPGLKQLLTQVRPVLQRHFDMAKQLQKSEPQASR